MRLLGGHGSQLVALPAMPGGALETDDYLWTTGTLATRILEAGLQIEKLVEPSWEQSPSAPIDAQLKFIPTCLIIVARWWG